MPNRDRQASSEAAWALITEGVTSARLEAHRLQHLVNRVLKLVEASKHTEHLHQIAGDIIVAAPKRLAKLNQELDRTALALSKMGETYLSARLPLSDKTLVEEAVDSAGLAGGGRRKSSPVERVASRWLVRQACIAAKPGDKVRYFRRHRHHREVVDGLVLKVETKPHSTDSKVLIRDVATGDEQWTPLDAVVELA